MSEQDKPFVINDRRKFRMDGEPREPLPTESSSTEAAAACSGSPLLFPLRSSRMHPASGPIPIFSAHTNSAHLVTPVPEPKDEEDENEPSSI